MEVMIATVMFYYLEKYCHPLKDTLGEVNLY